MKLRQDVVQRTRNLVGKWGASGGGCDT